MNEDTSPCDHDLLQIGYHDDTLLFAGVDRKTSTTDRARGATDCWARDKRKDLSPMMDLYKAQGEFNGIVDNDIVGQAEIMFFDCLVEKKK